MRTLRLYLWREVVVAAVFVLFALLSLFMFFDMVQQLDEIEHHLFPRVPHTHYPRIAEIVRRVFVNMEAL